MMKTKSIYRLILVTVAAAASSALIGCGKSSFNPGRREAPAVVLVPSAEKSTIEATSPHIADGDSASLVTLTIRTQDGTPVPGIALNMQVSGSKNIVVPCTASNSHGVSTCKVYSTWPETKTVQAGTITLWDKVLFVPQKQGKSIAGIVSSAGEMKATVGGRRIVASSGIAQTPFAIRDLAGVTRVQSSILASSWRSDRSVYLISF